jgi:hypothetical protein
MLKGWLLALNKKQSKCSLSLAPPILPGLDGARDTIDIELVKLQLTGAQLLKGDLSYQRTMSLGASLMQGLNRGV